MTREEAIDILTDIRDEVFAQMKTEEMIVVDELERKALSMAIKSLEAWEKVREEVIKTQTYKMFEGDTELYVERKDVLKIIDKHLKEVSE